MARLRVVTGAAATERPSLRVSLAPGELRQRLARSVLLGEDVDPTEAHEFHARCDAYFGWLSLPAAHDRCEDEDAFRSTMDLPTKTVPSAVTRNAGRAWPWAMMSRMLCSECAGTWPSPRDSPTDALTFEPTILAASG